ncbi:MAG: hypothetical protein EKK51_09835 [Mycolicibacterium sp.]|uniref:hypothetical protein n=1 Tax=Mycobacteriaceae TaxID=1762 RepID=UPI000FBE8177|nr:hypothetical protein [Mycolicibacterium sp.]RUP32606.1 MAG: hypothetical protein EKK51_09835 [Mycolicibacterium sp.]
MTIIVNVVTMWVALAITAISAVASLALTYSRERSGLIDRRAVKALPTLGIGAVFTALVPLLPTLVASTGLSRDPMPIHPNRVTDGIADAWVWAASIISVVWLYAVAAALVTTVIYFRQQRRLHAAGSQDS